MKNRWNDDEAAAMNGNLLDLRVYTSRLLGKESDLVLHGGGNTSVKVSENNLFGEEEDILYVKGSGWDLGTIEAEGFAPVRLEVLLKMADLETLSDPDMVKYQRAAMTNPNAPNPSVEAILHAIIPFTFVDHSHADAVVTITNTPDGLERIKSIYGDRVFIVPYVMPGFILAKEIYQMTKDVDWDNIEALILMNHGVFTFANDAKSSYDKMISIVSEAEDYLADQGAVLPFDPATGLPIDPLKLAELRKSISKVWGQPILVRSDLSDSAIQFSERNDLSEITQRGPVTPDHIIRTKRIPLLIEEMNIDGCVDYFRAEYLEYFKTHNTGDLTCLDAAPRWAIWPGSGILSFGVSTKNCRIISDISQHTIKAIQQAERLDKWQALPQKDLFEMEYWVLEQAKLAKGAKPKSFQGKVVLVTGSASGIGKACVEEFLSKGAVVAGLDITDQSSTSEEYLAIQCDLTDKAAVTKAVEQVVRHFGGLDIVVSNAGTFPKSHTVAEMDDEIWENSLQINLTAHRLLMTASIPYLELGIDPSFIIIGSKNVMAPGPGAGAYSVAKAGLAQLNRIASLELGSKGIRVNTIHPNAVYDTGIWTDEVLQARAKHYGLSVEEYKTNNVLKREVTSKDVSALASTLAGSVFSKTTGAQIPIDGGNDRVI